MRKNYQRQPLSPFLPAIAPASSQKNLSSTTRRDLKENNNVEQNTGLNFKMQPTYHCIAKRNSFKDTFSPFDELLNKKLLDKEGMDIPTQPKASRPWIAKQIDMNNLTTRTNKLKPIEPKKDSPEILRRKSCHQNSLSSSQETSFKTIMIDKTTQLPRTFGGRAVSLPREKLYSCKIAMKKGVFPMNQKKKGQQEILQFFPNDESISRIQGREQSEAGDQFISFDSYLHIEF